jgi:hypothetical protein
MVPNDDWENSVPAWSLVCVAEALWKKNWFAVSGCG